MRVKLDEDLSPIVGEPLVRAGQDVTTVVGQGWGGVKDHVLWPQVSTEGRMLMTADKGFADIRVYPPGDHPGIVVLRPDRDTVVAYRAMVQLLLERYSIDELAGCLVIVTPRGIRIRRPGT